MGCSGVSVNSMRNAAVFLLYMQNSVLQGTWLRPAENCSMCEEGVSQIKWREVVGHKRVFSWNYSS